MKRVLIALLLVLTTGQMMAQIRLPERPNRPKYVDHSEKTNGFWCTVEANVGTFVTFKEGIKGAQKAGLTVAGGYMVNEFFKIGAGLGGNYYFNDSEQIRNTSMKYNMPIFLDMRGNLTSQEVRNFVPYWSFDIGVAVHDGFFAAPTIGMRFGEMRDSWLLGLTVCFQQLDKHWTETDKQFAPHGKVSPEMLSFIGLKVGYEF
jgi:hypothetical protein